MLSSVLHLVSVRMRLAKLPLCLLISCSALLGVALAPTHNLIVALIVSWGILFLAVAGASLNSCQEYQIDGEMVRTKNRPLPAELLSLGDGVVQGVVFAVLGMIILLLGCTSYLPALLGGVALFLYNAVYTPLKRISVFAIVPGAIAGAMPPYIGWLAGGGEPLSYSAFLIFILFLLWQIPHFWLILLHHRADYQHCKFPSMIQYVGPKRLESMVLVWVLSMVIIVELFSVSSFEIHFFSRILLMGGAIFLAVTFCLDLCWLHRLGYKKLFIILNFVLLFSMLTVIVDTFIF